MHSFGTLAGRRKPAGPRAADMKRRVLSYLPLAHVAERVLVEQGWLATGMHIYFAESLETFAADLPRARPTLFFSVPRCGSSSARLARHIPPARLNRLLGIPCWADCSQEILKSLGLDQCRMAAAAAAPMPRRCCSGSRLGLPINEAYGMTENLAVSALHRAGARPGGHVGRRRRVSRCASIRPTGELQMRSPAVMLGYYTNDLTREAFTEDGCCAPATRARWMRSHVCASPAASRTCSRPARQVRGTGAIEDRLSCTRPSNRAWSRRQPRPAAGPV